jgi:hypothetical protein
MLIALSLLMTLATLAAVAYPFFARDSVAGSVGESGEQLQELLSERDAALMALRDLRFDQQVGKLSPEDMTAFEQDLRERAAESLRRIDDWEKALDDTQIEAAPEPPPAATLSSVTGKKICPNCQRPCRPDDAFCTSCGKSLRT